MLCKIKWMSECRGEGIFGLRKSLKSQGGRRMVIQIWGTKFLEGEGANVREKKEVRGDRKAQCWFKVESIHGNLGEKKARARVSYRQQVPNNGEKKSSLTSEDRRCSAIERELKILYFQSRLVGDTLSTCPGEGNLIS